LHELAIIVVIGGVEFGPAIEFLAVALEVLEAVPRLRSLKSSIESAGTVRVEFIAVSDEVKSMPWN
jgi:hypothetical protein